jgi:hypothetical protein
MKKDLNLNIRTQPTKPNYKQSLKCETEISNGKYVHLSFSIYTQTFDICQPL